MPVGDRQGDRAAEARDDGRRDRRAHGGAGEVPGLVGRGDLTPEDIVRLEEGDPARVVLLDQRRLPDEEVELVCASAAEVADAIAHARDPRRARDRRRRRVRSRARGAAAARISRRPSGCSPPRGRPPSISSGRSRRCATTRRPSVRGRCTAKRSTRCKRMSAHAADLFDPGTRALTHCNAGGLATGGYGSAVGALRAAWERGLLERVLVDETRPLLQGARLTAWELETRRHPARGDRGLRRRVADGARRGRPDRHRRRPHRRERRHGEQDRHVCSRGARRAPRHAALRRRADLDRRSRDADRRRDPDRGARPARGLVALPRPESRLRRHARRADHRDRHRGRRARPRDLPHEGADPRRRLRDAAPPAHGHRAEAAAARRRAGRWSTGSSTRSARREIDDVHLVTNAQFAEDFGRWAEGTRRLIVHDDGTTTNETRLGAIGDIRFVQEQRGSRRRPARRRGRQLFDYSLARLHRASGRQGRGRAPSRVYDVGDLELAKQYGDRRARRGRSHRRLRREAGAIPPTTLVRDRDVPLRTAPRPRSSRPTSTRATRPTSRGASSPGCTRASPSTATGSTGDWRDIGDAEPAPRGRQPAPRARAGLPLRNAYFLD